VSYTSFDTIYPVVKTGSGTVFSRRPAVGTAAAYAAAIAAFTYALVSLYWTGPSQRRRRVAAGSILDVRKVLAPVRILRWRASGSA
jgi:hypothetical protein